MRHSSTATSVSAARRAASASMFVAEVNAGDYRHARAVGQTETSSDTYLKHPGPRECSDLAATLAQDAIQEAVHHPVVARGVSIVDLRDPAVEGHSPPIAACIVDYYCVLVSNPMTYHSPVEPCSDV